MYTPLLSTGHADYYGTQANLAARLMASAAPGQVLVQHTATLEHITQLLPTCYSSKSLETDSSQLMELSLTSVNGGSGQLPGKVANDTLPSPMSSQSLTETRDSSVTRSMSKLPAHSAVLSNMQARYLGSDAAADDSVWIEVVGRVHLKVCGGL